ncbi:COG4315 family predicted lipoprotein [Streptomyces aidingensis]|uniref:Predicted lipoprotein with conserved Yx(FWY)xxD motif n=1 Tax=Streptomyces aidingensis TaxID=910347 RepID=A0A1I1MYD1_9ACTN|nr:hypothetical protein [Streptomyces aidingensis]SFC90106.1 Predicted lipoprotein with conserved Yx(FWY)xxD motif [Streptomyces aidingensis]
MSGSGGGLTARLPTVLWIVGATLAVGALTPVVGQAVTAPQPPAAAPAGTGEQPSGEQDADGTGEGGDPDGPGYSGDAQDSTDGAADEGRPGPADRLIGIAESVLGEIVVDAEGRTLYLSVLDRTDPPASACLSRQCLENWPPVRLPDAGGLPAPAADGIDAGLLGALERPDGTWQATLGGWPLYRYAGEEPGEVSGDGMGGTWFAITPEGTPAVR